MRNWTAPECPSADSGEASVKHTICSLPFFSLFIDPAESLQLKSWNHCDEAEIKFRNNASTGLVPVTCFRVRGPNILLHYHSCKSNPVNYSNIHYYCNKIRYSPLFILIPRTFSDSLYRFSALRWLAFSLIYGKINICDKKQAVLFTCFIARQTVSVINLTLIC